MEAPVVVPLAGWRDPIDVLPLFAGEPMSTLLHSGEAPKPGSDVNRWSFLCASPFDVIRWSVGEPSDPFRLLEDSVGRYRCPAPGEFPFGGGAVGYIGYEVGRAVEPIRSAGTKTKSQAGAAIPDLLFGIYPWTIAWDHHGRRWAIVSTGNPERGPARRARALADVERILGRLQRPARPGPVRVAHEAARILATSVPRDRYVGMVTQAKSLIAEGELYQVNLSQRLEMPAPTDPMAMFREIARRSPAPFSAWFDAGEFQIASASPERLCSLHEGSAESRPIKGTRSRGRTPAEDEALARELAESWKDRAENVMIVDLVRNDLGRVCATGTVRAIDVCRMESYASVHHLTSVVRGVMGADRGRADLLRAVFPCGSMTGAPKVRAMQAIEDLEPVPRGIYAGALGYLSFSGSMDLSVVIRTAVVAGGRTWLSVGGGVVADSDPIAEWRESLHKATSVLRGMGITWTRAAPLGPGRANRPSGR